MPQLIKIQNFIFGQRAFSDLDKHSSIIFIKPKIWEKYLQQLSLMQGRDIAANIDLRGKKGKILVDHLIQQTRKIRNKIQLERTQKKKGSEYVQYHVKFDQIKVSKILFPYKNKSKILFPTAIQAQNQAVVWEANLQQFIGQCFVKISTSSLYPFQMGYICIGSNTNPQVIQICSIQIRKNDKGNYQKYYMGPINYGDNPDYNLCHCLGILIAQQIRFDTLLRYAKIAQNQQLNAQNLFRQLFNNFKRLIYNRWTKDKEWPPQQQMKISLKSFNNKQVTITRLIKSLGKGG